MSRSSSNGNSCESHSNIVLRLPDLQDRSWYGYNPWWCTVSISVNVRHQSSWPLSVLFYLDIFARCPKHQPLCSVIVYVMRVYCLRHARSLPGRSYSPDSLALIIIVLSYLFFFWNFGNWISSPSFHESNRNTSIARTVYEALTINSSFIKWLGI